MLAATLIGVAILRFKNTSLGHSAKSHHLFVSDYGSLVKLKGWDIAEDKLHYYVSYTHQRLQNLNHHWWIKMVMSLLEI